MAEEIRPGSAEETRPRCTAACAANAANATTHSSKQALPIRQSTLTPGTCGRRVARKSSMVDVFVIGGGPAGAAAARLLASWGWSVRVAHRPAGSRPSLAESLPPSTRKLLQFVGLLEAVEAVGFHPNFGNIARWGEQRRTTTS